MTVPLVTLKQIPNSSSIEAVISSHANPFEGIALKPAPTHEYKLTQS